MKFGLKVDCCTLLQQDNCLIKQIKKGQIFLALFFIKPFVNSKFKKIIPQLLTLTFVALVFGFFSYNAQLNMDNRGITFGYGFLSQESSFDVQFSLIEYDGSHSYFRAYLVGLLTVSYTHLRAHETSLHLVCRLLLEKKK